MSDPEPTHGPTPTGVLTGNPVIVECSVDEATARFYGEWVLMKITGFDEYHDPDYGLVLAHSPRREDVSTALRREPPRSAIPPDAPYQPYYTFYAVPLLRPGETLEEGEARFDALRAAVAGSTGGCA